MFNSRVLIGLGILTYLGLMLPGLNTPWFGAWFCALILDSWPGFPAIPRSCKWFGVRLVGEGHVTGHICAWRESDLVKQIGLPQIRPCGFSPVAGVALLSCLTIEPL